MTAVGSPYLVDTYDVEIALKLIGPANFGAAEPRGCIEYLSLIIKEIAIFILRVANYCCGDHQWYNNAKARFIVNQYFNGPVGSQILHQKVTELFNALELRAVGQESRVDIAAANARQARITALHNSEVARAQEEAAHEAVLQKFHKGETGNLTLVEVFKHYQSMTTEDGTPVFESEEFLLNETLPGIEASLQRHSIDLEQYLSQGEKSDTVDYNDLHKRIAEPFEPRKYQIRPGDLDRNIEVPEEEKNQRYQTAYDPHTLFRRALFDAMRELDYNANLLQSQYFPRTEEMDKACALAVYNLLLQSEIDNGTCAGPLVKFNGMLSARYQAPKVYHTNDDSVEHFYYNTDLFSSSKVGCDPEGARRILERLKTDGSVESFKDFLLGNRPEAALSDEAPLAKELIETMARQVRDRYGEKLIPMIVRDMNGVPDPVRPPLAESDFKTFTESAETPHEYIFRGLIHSLQAYANQGLATADDLMGDAGPTLQKLFCRKIAFESLKTARVPHDFRIELSEHVKLDCGKFYIYEPTLADPRHLTARLLYTPHVFSGDGSEHDLASDPIKIKTMMDRFTPSELLTLEKYIYSNNLTQLYREKGLENPDQFERETQAEMARLSPEKQEIMREIYAQLTNVALIINDKFMDANHGSRMMIDVLDEIAWNDEAIPTPIRFVLPPPPSETLTQDVLMQYLPSNIKRSDIIIKERPIRTVGTSVKVKWSDYPHSIGSAIRAQNIVIDNYARCGNCMYGALAMEIFGEDKANTNIDQYASILRNAVADYMWANKEQFLMTMIDDVDRQYGQVDRLESEEAFMNRMRGTLETKLRNHCDRIRDTVHLEWGTGRELEAVAAIFGVPIHVFNETDRMTIASGPDAGIEDGVIQPNSTPGNRFTGAPIRIKYSGNHYHPIRLRT